MTGAPECRTRWPIIAIAVLTGVVCAIQVGKVPAALPALRAELGLSLVVAGWTASLFNLCGAVLGIAAALLCERTGPRAMMVASLLILAGGGGLGALAGGAPLLLFSRFVEGLGFVGAAVAAPTVLVAASAGRDRGLAFGLWGTYLPLGSVIGLLMVPPLLEPLGWRGIWWLNAAIAAGFAGLVLTALAPARWPALPRGRAGRRPHAGRTALALPGPWLYAACFGVYSLQYFAVATWVPTFLIETRGTALAAAAMVGALVVMGNIGGNLVCGLLMRRGVPRWRLLLLAYPAMAVCAWLVFAAPAPELSRVPAALVLTLFGGLLPAACFAGAPAHARHADEVALCGGIVVQGANIGNLAGAPVMAAAVVLLGGWDQGYWVMVVFGSLGCGFALALRRLETARPTPVSAG